jgi:protein-S-isoprenylcysteine O-methyltransferase Ste14
MESPASIVFALCYLLSPRPISAMSWIFFVLWQLHYFHRAFIFPFRLRSSPKALPVGVALLGWSYCVFNGWFVASGLVTYVSPSVTTSVMDPRFLIGVVVFLFGYGMNLYSDTVLIHLRAPGETGYKIPRGGMYRFISCPNYFGEMIEWFGFALATWSLPALAFAVWTVGNLAPRAMANHRWYKSKFPDYPPERKALVPFVV